LGCGNPDRTASSNARFLARLPCIFQLPATSLVRVIEILSKPLNFTAL
jgi:hypothetical protein